MKKAIAIQLLIFIGAYFSMTPDILEDNTHVFGLFGNYDLVHGNAHWVLLGAAILSVLNIWVWWPKAQVTSTNEAPTAEGTKSAAVSTEVKDKDPVVPKMD